MAFAQSNGESTDLKMNDETVNQSSLLTNDNEMINDEGYGNDEEYNDSEGDTTDSFEDSENVATPMNPDMKVPNTTP
jgi:hypothetical protein